ncbi:MAG: hypothetical protein ACFFED_10355 [Candidatus Thorarchaeota archaeon]
MTADDFESRSYEQQTTPELEKLKTRSKNGCVAGCLLMLSPLVFFALAFILPPSLLNRVFLPALIGFFGLAIVGVIVLGLFAIGSNTLVRAYEILLALGPPEPQIGKRYVVRELNDVYIIGHSLSGMFYFIAFRGQAGLASTSKMRIPQALWKWEKRIEVGSHNLYRREGVFAVPTERGDFLSGEGVLYAEAFIPSKYNLIVPDFKKDDLLAIVERVSEDAMNPSYE